MRRLQSSRNGQPPLHRLLLPSGPFSEAWSDPVKQFPNAQFNRRRGDLSSRVFLYLSYDEKILESYNEASSKICARRRKRDLRQKSRARGASWASQARQNQQAGGCGEYKASFSSREKREQRADRPQRIPPSKTHPSKFRRPPGSLGNLRARLSTPLTQEAGRGFLLRSSFLCRSLPLVGALPSSQP